MHKILMISAMALVVLGFVVSAQAATFDGAPGEISAALNGNNVTISVDGVGDIAAVVRYRIKKGADGQWIDSYSLSGGSTTFDVTEGDRVQLVNREGKFLFISPEWCVSRHNPVKLTGFTCDFVANPGGTLQVK